MLGSRVSSQRSRDSGQDWYLPIDTVLTLCVASCRWGSGLSHALWDLPSATEPTALGRSYLCFLIQKTLWTISLRMAQLDQTWAALEQG